MLQGVDHQRHQANINRINGRIEFYLENGYPISFGDPQQIARNLAQELMDLEASAKTMLPESSKIEIQKRYEEADQNAEDVWQSLRGQKTAVHPNTRTLLRCASRLSMGNGGEVCVTDFDGTVSGGARLGETFFANASYMEHLIPGSKPAHLLKEIKFSTADIHALTYRMALFEGPEVMRNGGAFVEIRPGFDMFVKELINSGGSITILSANFDLFIREALKKVPNNDLITNILALQADSIKSRAKADNLALIVGENPLRPLVYVGDEESDIGTLRVKGIVGWYHALRDASFHKALKENQALCLPFETYNDVVLQHRQIRSLASQYFTN